MFCSIKVKNFGKYPAMIHFNFKQRAEDEEKRAEVGMSGAPEA
jgi:hypothetical protein